MNEPELYREPGKLTKDKGAWEENISYVSSLLVHESSKIQAKALWLLGEMGLAHPNSVESSIPAIAPFLDKRSPELVLPYIEKLREIAGADENRVVRIHCLDAIKATEKAAS